MAHERIKPEFLFDEEKIDRLKQIAPECFEDGKLNFETLRQNLGDWTQDEEDGELEHFGLFWPGKKDSRRLATIPPEGTLEPVYGEGLKSDGTPDDDGVNDSKNIFIEGENLEVLKILQKSYANKIKMIYIDPPYNTGNDFVYDDDFTEPLQEYLRRTGQIDEDGKPLTTNKKSDGRFHSKWLCMMYPRLRLAYSFLRQDGAIFISIDDNEINNLKMILNEVFGEENFIAQLVWSGGRKNDSKFISLSHEYILVYAKSKDYLIEHKIIWRLRKEGLEEIYEKHKTLVEKHGNDFNQIENELKSWYKSLDKDNPILNNKHYNCVDEKGIYFPSDISWPGGGGPQYEVLHPLTQKPVKRPSRGWIFPHLETMNKVISEDKVHFGDDENKVPCLKTYLKDKEGQVPYSVFYQDGRASTKRLRKILGEDLFDHPKDEIILSQLIEIMTDDGDFIMDFFAGSGSTGHALWELNQKQQKKRNFLLIQLPSLIDSKESAYKAGYKNIAQICRFRLEKCSEIYRVNNTDDYGFKTLKLANSNYRKWHDIQGEDLSNLENSLNLFNSSPLKEDWSKNKLITELMLLEGFPLDASQAQSIIGANKIAVVESEMVTNTLLICLDDKIKEDLIESLDLDSTSTFICLDSAISNQNKLRLSDKGLIKTI